MYFKLWFIHFIVQYFCNSCKAGNLGYNISFPWHIYTMVVFFRLVYVPISICASCLVVCHRCLTPRHISSILRANIPRVLYLTVWKTHKTSRGDNCIRLQEFPISFELTEEMCSYYEGKNLVSLLLFMKTNSIHFISLNFKMVGDICVIGTFLCQWCIFGTPCWCKNWLWCQLCHNFGFWYFQQL